MNDLARRKCIPCQGGVPPLKGRALAAWRRRLGGEWGVVRSHHLAKTYRFEDFAGALDFTNRIGALAEREWHHPDLELAWGRVGVTLFTHKIDGLSASDFIFAAKIDALARRWERERRRARRR